MQPQEFGSFIHRAGQRCFFSNRALRKKIDFLIVIISIITLRLQQACNKTLRFVASAFLITYILETTPARMPKFFAKLKELKNLQNNHKKKLWEILILTLLSRSEG